MRDGQSSDWSLPVRVLTFEMIRMNGAAHSEAIKLLTAIGPFRDWSFARGVPDSVLLAL